MTTRFAVLKFYPNQSNSARASGRGTYRVVSCHESEEWAPVVQLVRWNRTILAMRLRVARAVKPRSRVDPRKLALEYVRSQV